MFFQPKSFNLFLLLSFFMLCHSNETSTIPTILTPTTVTTLFNVDEELQRAAAFKKALVDMAEALSSDEPIGQNLKKLLDASRMCGIVFNESAYTWNKMQSYEEIRDVAIKMDHLYLFSVNDLNYKIERAELNLISRHIETSYNILFLERNIINPIQNLTNLFVNFRIAANGNNFNKEAIDNLKIGCKWYDPNNILEAIRSFDRRNAVRDLVVEDNYSDQAFESVKTIIHDSLKLTFSMLPFCPNFLHGRQIDQSISFFARFTLRRIHIDFNEIKTERKENFWKNKIIEKLIKKHVVNTPQTSRKYDNDNIQIAVFNDLNKSYGSFGYNYQVAVSNAAQLGHNDTLLQCSTECHYLYNFLGKDIYVMRTQKSKNYSTCQHLDKFETYEGYCYSGKNSTDSLEPLANEIVGNCSSSIAAFSLTRYRLQMNSNYLYEENGFLWKCSDDTTIIVAFKPHY